MKKAKCGISNTTLCAMAASVLGLFGTAVLLTAAGAKKHCSDNGNCSAECAEQKKV